MNHSIINYKKSELYKDLKLFIAKPSDEDKDRPVIIFFHGAGFSNNKVNSSQFEHHAKYFAAQGFVTVCAEYRPLELEGPFSPIDSLENAKSAIRWIRENSSDLGVNPNKIIAAGASAGGYLCLCAAMINQFDDPYDNIFISAKPDALIIFNGGVDSELLIRLFPDLEAELLEASPSKNIREGLPPSLFFHGTEDKNIPIQDVQQFTETMHSTGNISKLITFEGVGHGFFNYGNLDNKPYIKTLSETEDFLKQLNILG
jgi:acetyl esterase